MLSGERVEPDDVHLVGEIGELHPGGGVGGMRLADDVAQPLPAQHRARHQRGGRRTQQALRFQRVLVAEEREQIVQVERLLRAGSRPFRPLGGRAERLRPSRRSWPPGTGTR